MEWKVFVALANGELAVYRRNYDKGGCWDFEHQEVLIISNATSPITRMVPVAGKLWCCCQNEIMVINPHSLIIEVRFQAKTLLNH